MKILILILVVTLNILPEVAKAAPGPMPDARPDALIDGRFFGLGRLDGFSHGLGFRSLGIGLGRQGIGRNNGWGTDGPVGGGAGLWDVERKKNISKQRFNLKHLLTFSIKLMLK